jgi:hypothetical protein
MHEYLKTLFPQGGLMHITAEYNGLRYYIGSDVNIPEAEKIALQYKSQFPLASFYLTDRDCSINGFNDDFQTAYKGI